MGRLGVILGDPTRYQTFREWLAEAQTDRPHVPVPGSSAYYTVGDAVLTADLNAYLRQSDMLSVLLPYVWPTK